MDTKEQLLTLFEQNKGQFFSGEALAERLSVSRTAIWKAVRKLRSEGYAIDAVPNKGYCLSPESDILSPQGIEQYLDKACRSLALQVIPSVPSTNALVYELAAAGAPEGCVIIAQQQTAGKGRQGRRFFSPPDSGLYLSLLLRPKQASPSQALSLTTMAAVAVCEAIELVSGEKAEIKWVNDIFVRGKKVCGILTEASFQMESGFLDYAILGIGVNVFPPQEGFPEELSEIAGAVFSRPCSGGKNRLCAQILNRFMAYYQSPDAVDHVQKYRSRSFLTGKKVLVCRVGMQRPAMVEDIDEACRLLVRYEDGSREALFSGEVRILPQ